MSLHRWPVFALLLTLACGLAGPAAAATRVDLPTCSWNQPGHAPFGGDVVAAVDRYTDIPAAVRARLKARMASRAYDEVVSIRRNAIVGRAQYGAAISDMHFAGGRVCASVDRSAWAADAQERGLVYCESGECILVPTVCRNVSRIRREPAVAAAAAAAGGTAGEVAGVSSDQPTSPALSTAATGAEEPMVESAGTAKASVLADANSPASADGSFSAALAANQVMAAASGPPAQWPPGPIWPSGPVSGSDLVSHDNLSRALRVDDLPFDAPATALLPAVPEPGTWALLLAGLALLAGWARRRARHLSPA